MNLILVYQAGIANVFEVSRLQVERHWSRARLLQTDFRTAEAFCLGAQCAGATVRAAACNMAGDIALQDWTWDLESQPFSDKFRPLSGWRVGEVELASIMAPEELRD